MSTDDQAQVQNLLSPQALYFLTVNYHSAALLAELMPTLGKNQGIVIVNNSPNDRDADFFADQTFSGGTVTVLTANQNRGFGAGCNLGLKWIYARSPQALVWLINPDAQLLPQAVDSLRRSLAQQPDIVILGTPILDTAHQLWSGAGKFNRWTGAVTTHPTTTNPLTTDGALDRLSPIPARWVSGCSMVLNLLVLGHCPQFDELYFLYYEDCDLCERYLKQGKTVAITPTPLVVHAVSSITGRNTQLKYFHATFSKLTFLKHHATPLALGLNLVYLLGRSLGYLAHDPAAAQGQWLGICHFFRHCLGR